MRWKRGPHDFWNKDGFNAAFYLPIFALQIDFFGNSLNFLILFFKKSFKIICLTLCIKKLHLSCQTHYYNVLLLDNFSKNFQGPCFGPVANLSKKYKTIHQKEVRFLHCINTLPEENKEIFFLFIQEHSPLNPGLEIVC